MIEKFNLEKELTINFIATLRKNIEDWESLGENEKTAEGKYENDVRQEEKKVVSALVEHLRTYPNEAENLELKKVVAEYLQIGDCMDLKKELRDAMGIKSFEPLSDEDNYLKGAAKQVLGEIKENDKKEDDDDYDRVLH